MSKVIDNNLYIRAQNRIENGDLHKAEQLLKKEITQNQLYVPPIIELTKVLASLDKVEEAILLLQEGINNDIKDYRLYAELGALTELCGNAEEARQYYIKSVKLKNNAPLWIYHGANIDSGKRVFLYMEVLEDEKLLYLPMAKCASTTIKAMISSMRGGRQVINPHQYFDNPSVKTKKVAVDDYDGYYCFTVIRDPVARFLSYYKKNILEENTLRYRRDKSRPFKKYVFGLDTKPNINYFVDRYEDYQYFFHDVRHHTLPQSAYLGGGLDSFDGIYTLDTLNELEMDLSKKFGVDIKMPHFMKSSDSISKLYPSLSLKTLEKLIAIYEQDYALFKRYYDPDKVLAEYADSFSLRR